VPHGSSRPDKDFRNAVFKSTRAVQQEDLWQLSINGSADKAPEYPGQGDEKLIKYRTVSAILVASLTILPQMNCKIIYLEKCTIRL
jgi:hypothetical protein